MPEVMAINKFGQESPLFKGMSIGCSDLGNQVAPGAGETAVGGFHWGAKRDGNPRRGGRRVAVEVEI